MDNLKSKIKVLSYPILSVFLDEIEKIFAGTSHKHADADITSVSASKLTGTIDIARLPHGALERCVVVADDTARFKLTKSQVQTGDTVKVSTNGMMYFVIDDTKLSSESGYEIYTSGSATSVPWSGITEKPSTFPPASHSHDDRYFTESETNTKLNTKANVSDLTSHTGNTIAHITATERTNWNSAKTHAESAHAPSNAEPNQNAFSNVKVGTTTIVADTKTDVLEIAAGSNITVTPDATNDKITISAIDTKYTHPSHTAKANGLYKVTVDSLGHISGTTPVSKSDITALGIPGQDTNTIYGVMKGATTSTAGTQGLTPAPSAGASNRYLRSDGTWSVPPDTNTTYGVASQSANGLLSAADKKKLDGVATGANKYTHPTTSGNKHIPSGGAAGQFLKWSADGTAVWANDNNTKYSNMTGATASAAGKSGLVPAPAAGSANRYLRSDGTWQVPPDTKTTLSSLGVTATASELNKLDGCKATVTELNYVDGVTSNIQTQLNGKAAKTHSHALIQKTEPTTQNNGDLWLIEG